MIYTYFLRKWVLTMQVCNYILNLNGRGYIKVDVTYLCTVVKCKL